MIANTLRTRRAIVLVGAGFIALGAPAGAFGVAWPTMRGTFHQPVSSLGLLLFMFGLAHGLGAAVGGRLPEGVGLRSVPAVATALAGLGLLAMAVAPSWPTVIAAAGMSGTGGGVLDATLNTWAARGGGKLRTLNVLHAGFPIGATIGPVLLAALAAAGVSWRFGFGALGCAYAVLAMMFGRFLPVREPEATAEPSGPPVPLVGLAIVAGMATFFMYVGAEITIGQWSSTLLHEGRGMSASGAGLAAAGFWFFFGVGRLVVGFGAQRRSPSRVFEATLIAAGSGALALWALPGAISGVIAICVVGAGMAAIFPTLVALTALRVQGGRGAALIGFQVAAAAVGGAVIPGGVGFLVAWRGVEVVGPVVVCCLLLVAILDRANTRFVREATSRYQRKETADARRGATGPCASAR